MAQAKLLPAPLRSCEECLAIRAPFSKPRHLPRPAVVSPADQLRALLQHPLPEPLHARAARKALASDDEASIARELRSYKARLAQRQASSQKLAQLYPTLYPAA